jgi:hypothetical protein
MEKSMQRTLGIAIGIGFGILAASSAIAQTTGSPGDSAGTTTVGRMGDVQIFAGVRLWANEWDLTSLRPRRTFDPSNPSSPVLRDEITTALSDLEVVPMPTIGARYGNFLASVTYFVPTTYSGEGSPAKSIKRSEIDINAGYFVLPSLLLSVGYKHAKIDRLLDEVDSGQKISALLLGLSGSAPLADRLSLYGNVAYGIARQKSEVKDARGEDEYSSTYAIGELGLSYRFMEGGASAFVKSLTGSIGYRAQSYTTKDVGLGTYQFSDPTILISTTTRDVRTSTSGVVVALVASF